VIATVSDEPERLVADRRLRADVLYRLAVFAIHLPPLRERRGDIVALAEAFLESAPEGRGRDLASCARQFLVDHEWPGNVRELESLMVRAAVCVPHSTLVADDLRVLISPHQNEKCRSVSRALGAAPSGRDGCNGALVLPRPLRGDRNQLTDLVDRHRGYAAAAARTISVPRTTLRRWLGEVGLAGVVGRGRPRQGGNGENGRGHFVKWPGNDHGHLLAISPQGPMNAKSLSERELSSGDDGA
jgi:transcriptional regulator with PAS, ATPase and Fis domain